MSYVIAAPEIMTSAATDLATIGSNLGAAHKAAAAATVAVLPAAADEVSAGIAQLFSEVGQDAQVLAAQATAFGEQFVQNLASGAFSYAGIEAALASLLQNLTVTVEQTLASFEEPLFFVLLIALIAAALLATAVTGHNFITTTFTAGFLTGLSLFGIDVGF